jgi:signal transduction histidine kinase
VSGVRHVSDTIAHNLRTPLTRVVLRLRAAQEPGVPEQVRHAEIAAAQRDLQDLTVTFEKLLQIAEAEAGTRRGRFGRVALHAIADDVVELYEALAEAGGSRLLREGDEVAVDGDRDLLADAIANLVDNALKYAGEGVTVRVITRARHDAVVLAVQDDGPGVPHGEHARMGSRFHRLDRSKPGYGLGLASVRAVALLHGGQLLFSDARPGLRAELQLPLPAAGG